MENSSPNSKSARSPDDRKKPKRIVAERGLCGLANDTKWDELVCAVRARHIWTPSYRYKCIDGAPSSWDVEWFHHLPYPMVSVEWLDIAVLQEVREHRLPPRVHVTDHSIWLEALLREVGLDYQKGRTMIRVFGYSPKRLDLFEQ